LKRAIAPGRHGLQNGVSRLWALAAERTDGNDGKHQNPDLTLQSLEYPSTQKSPPKTNSVSRSP